MAVYSVSSSGNLKIADTGLGSPVSFFAYEGFVTNPLAGAPLTGQLAKVWVIPTSNRFSSSGRLRLSGTIVRSQSSIAASAIGESPTAGGENSNVQVSTLLGFVAGLEQSTGNLKLTGSSSVVKAYKISSAGNLKTTGAVSSPATVKRQTAGNLKLTGSTAARAIFATKSAGSLIITGFNSFRDIEQTTSAGVLTITGSTFSHKTYNKTSAGQLRTSGSKYVNLKLAPTSVGNLVVTTKTYDPTYQGGVATNSVASIYDSLPATLRTTATSFYGDIHSSGSLTITPTGEIVAPLSSTSVVAGSALAETALAGGMDTIRRASTFTTFYAPTSSGLLHIQGPSTAIQYDNDTAGNLTISGSTVPAFIRDFLTNGSLRTNGANITVRTLGFDTAGNIVLPNTNGFTTSELSNSSGIAASAIASTPVGGSSDYYEAYHFAKTLGYNSAGSLVLNGAEVDTETLDFLSAGQLRLTGQTVIEQQLGVLSSGRIVTTGSNITVRTLGFNSAGNETVGNTDGFTTAPLSTSSGIAASAIASTPVGGSSDYFSIYHFAKTLGYNSAGNLQVNGSTSYAKTLDFLSAGNLSVIGITGTGQQNLVISEGYLTTSGNNITVKTLHFDTAGNSKLVDVSGYVTSLLGDSSGIAGSALATQPIGSGIDLHKGFDFVRNLGFPTEGNLVVAGSDVSNRTLHFDSAGNLTIAGYDVFVDIEDPRSAGQLELAGQTISVRTLHFDSAGNITVGNTNGFTTAPLSDSSGIAASAIASTPVGGSSDYFSIYHFAKTLGYNTSGNLVTAGSTSYAKTLDFLSAGQLTIIGNTGSGQQNLADSAGSLSLSGANITVRTLNFKDAGSIVTSSTGYKVGGVSLDGAIAGSAIASGNTEYSAISVALANGRLTAGNLLLPSSTTVVRTLGFNSHGNLVLVGSANRAETWAEFSQSNILRITGSSTHTTTWAPESSGLELFKHITLTAQNSLAASALGEFPLAGGTDNIPTTSVLYVKGAPVQTSAGILVISGSLAYVSSELELTSGELVLAGSTRALTITKTKTAGSLKITSSSAHSSTIKPKSLGNLVVRSNKLGILQAIKPRTSGDLVITGSAGSNLLVRRDTAGDLILISNSLANMNVAGVTAQGNLTFADHWYNRIAAGAGIAVNGIGSSPIAGAEESTFGTLRRTVVNYVGPRVSTGNLKLSAVGTRIVTDTSSLASGAIASTSLAGSNTSGNLAARVSYISKGVAYSDHVFYATSSGLMKLRGRTTERFAINGNVFTDQLFEYTTSGRLRTNGANAVHTIHAETTSGRLVVAGTNAVRTVHAERTSARLVVNGTNAVHAIHIERTSGRLSVAGSSTANVAHAETSADQLVTNGTNTHYVVKSRSSAGNLHINGRTLTDKLGKGERTSGGIILTTGSSSISTLQVIASAGSIVTTGTVQSNVVYGETSAGTLNVQGTHAINRTNAVESNTSISLVGSTAHNTAHAETTAGDTAITTESKYNIISIISSIGSVGVIGGFEEYVNVNEQSSGNVTLSGNTEIEITTQQDSAGNVNLTTESKYNIISIISSIGSVGVIGGVEDFSSKARTTNGRIKVSGKTDIVISIKPGSRGFTRVTGETKTQTILNKEHMGGSGIYYGPWGAPFVMPFAKEWEEVDGKRRRKVSRLQVAIRFSKGERWTRTHYNLNKMNKGVMVAASALRPAQTPSIATAPISNKPNITVNASAFRLIQNNVPNVDVSDFTVVESEKVKVQDFTEKSTLVETGSIKQNNYRINATVDVDTTSFKVTVALPKSTVDA